MEWHMLKELGRGAYGKVQLIEDPKSKTKYVLKDVDLSNASAKERMSADMEVKILSTLRHPNIVQYKWSYQTKQGSLHIIMAYCDGGDLHSLIKTRQLSRLPDQYFTEKQILDWFVQITMAVEYIHDRKILHRDLKTPNIFLTRNNVIKVGDFGISRILDRSGDYAMTLIGTPFYMSPEIFLNKPYDYKSDIWAIGCCLYELCELKHPFTAEHIDSLRSKVLTKKPVVSERYCAIIHKLVKACLYKAAEKRPSAAKILRHPDIRTHIKSYLKSSMQMLKEKNVVELKNERRSSVVSTKNIELSESSSTFDGMLPQITGTSIRSFSVGRKRKRPRLQHLKDKSQENKEEKGEENFTNTENLTDIILNNEEIPKDEIFEQLALPKVEDSQLLLTKVRSSSAVNLTYINRNKETGRIIVSAGPTRVNEQDGAEGGNDDVESLITAMRNTLKMSENDA